MRRAACPFGSPDRHRPPRLLARCGGSTGSLRGACAASEAVSRQACRLTPHLSSAPDPMTNQTPPPCPHCAGTGRLPASCANCGEPFFGRRQDAVYCDKCRTVGPQRKYEATSSPIRAAYRREYKRLDKHARRGRFSRAELDAWRVEAAALVADAERERWDGDRFRLALANISPTTCAGVLRSIQ